MSHTSISSPYQKRILSGRQLKCWKIRGGIKKCWEKAVSVFFFFIVSIAAFNLHFACNKFQKFIQTEHSYMKSYLVENRRLSHERAKHTNQEIRHKSEDAVQNRGFQIFGPFLCPRCKPGAHYNLGNIFSFSRISVLKIANSQVP